MRPVTVFPFLRPPAEAISASSWWDGKGEALQEGDHLDEWDPWTAIGSWRTLEINQKHIQEFCQLGSDARLRVTTSWLCPATSLRQRSTTLDLDPASREVSLTVDLEAPGHMVASEIVLQTRLTLHQPGETPGRLAPDMPGSILWGDDIRLRLEGAGPRFPVEVVNFPEETAYAGWELAISPELDYPFLGGVRLYINGKNEAVRRAIESRDPTASDRAVTAAMYADIARQLVRFALGNEDFLQMVPDTATSSPFTRESTGFALLGLIGQLFPEESIPELARQFEASPTHFDTVIQDRIRLLEGN